MRELPHVTVATVVTRDEHYLMVKEEDAGSLVYNQPAGHVEVGESLQAAALRETLEETGWRVTLDALLGIYQYTSAANGVSYVRVCFAATAVEPVADAELDSEILAVEWLSPAQISALECQWRSPMVGRAIADFERGVRYPLALIQQ